MIHRHLASAALTAALLCAAPAFAQTAPAPAATASFSASHLQAAREVVELTGVSGSFDLVYKDFVDNTRQLINSTRPELAKDSNEIVELLKPEADKRREEMTTAAVGAFARRMTEADLKEVAAFFSSPVGKRYTALRPQAVDDIYTVLQPWSTQTANMLFDRFAAEMRKRGHPL